MLRPAAILLGLMLPVAALAAPATLTDLQMDSITAGKHKHHGHHRGGYKLFGKTKFYYRGKVLAKDSGFEQKKFDLGHAGHLAVGVEHGYIVAAGHKYKRPYAKSKSRVKAYGRGVDKFLSGSASERGYLKGRHHKGRHHKGWHHKGRHHKKIAWGTSAGWGVVVALNDKYFYGLNKHKRKYVLKHVKRQAYKKFGQAKKYASKYLAPPKVRMPRPQPTAAAN